MCLTHPAGGVWVVSDPSATRVWQQDGEVHIGERDSSDEVAAVGIEGKVTVHIWASVGLLECTSNPSDRAAVPNVLIRRTGTVDRFVGLAQLGYLEGRIFAKRESLRRPPGRLIGPIEGVLGGGTLVGVDITGVHPSFLEKLAELAVCSPDVQSFYNDATRWDSLTAISRRFRRREPPVPLGAGVGTPRARAHWYRDLYGALRDQAIPATVRAAIRWSYALLEHEAIKAREPSTTHSEAKTWSPRLLRWPLGERFGRSLYRLVGYGQRPSRALACWFLATVGVTAWSACTAQGGNIVDHLELFAAILVSPLRVLRLGNQPDTPLVDPHRLEGLAYVVIGVPFVFVLISLREFFRSPLSGRARQT